MAFEETQLLWAIVISNSLWIYLVFGVRNVIGQGFFDDAIKVITKRFKQPIIIDRYYKSQYADTRIHDATKPLNFSKNHSTPVTLNESMRYNGEGKLKRYILQEGWPENIDPMNKDVSLWNEVIRIGENINKVLDTEENRLKKRYAEELVTKKHFNMGILIVLIGVIAVLAIIYNMNQAVEAFQATYQQYKPAIEAAIANLPRIEGG